jgi:hypothetical protein
MAGTAAPTPKEPYSQTGPSVPVEMNLLVPSKQRGTCDPTCNKSPEMNNTIHSDLTERPTIISTKFIAGNKTVCSLATEPHVLPEPGYEEPGSQEHVQYGDIEGLPQPLTENTSHKQGIVHKAEDSQWSRV